MHPAIINGFEEDAYNKHSKRPTSELSNHLNDQLGWTQTSGNSEKDVKFVERKTTGSVFGLEILPLTSEPSVEIRNALRFYRRTKQKGNQESLNQLNSRLTDLRLLAEEDKEPFSETAAKQLAEFVDNYRLGIPSLTTTADGAIRALWNTQIGKIELDFSGNTICTLLISKEPGNRSFAGRITAFDTAPRLFKEFMRYFVATRSSR